MPKKATPKPAAPTAKPATLPAPQGPTFSKEQIVHAHAFEDYRHVAAALLGDNRRYTIQEAKNIIETFLGKAVN